MKVYPMTGLDHELEKLIKELEYKYNCFIALTHNEEKIYMSVIFKTELELVEYIPVGDLNASKYHTMTLIRRWFRLNR